MLVILSRPGTWYDLGSDKLMLGSVLRRNCKESKGLKQAGQSEEGYCDNPEERTVGWTSDSSGSHRKQLDLEVVQQQDLQMDWK